MNKKRKINWPAYNKQLVNRGSLTFLFSEGTYRKGSGWNDTTEMMCLLIYKKLKKEGFSKGKPSELCEEMFFQKGVNLTSEATIHMKVHNYEFIDTNGKKGLEGYSSNTERIYQKYKNTPIEELEQIINVRDPQKEATS